MRKEKCEFSVGVNSLRKITDDSHILLILNSDTGAIAILVHEMISDSKRGGTDTISVACLARMRGHLSATQVHLLSKGDVVHRLDRLGSFLTSSTSFELPPAPGVAGLDHEFQSPTFKPDLKRNLENYLKYGKLP